jgi:hypothetical protein
MAQNNANTGKQTRESTPPAFIAYAVSERGRGRKFWTRLGGVYEHRKGEGFNVYLNVLPVDFDGRIVLLPPKADEEQDGTPADDAGTEEQGEGA